MRLPHVLVTYVKPNATTSKARRVSANELQRHARNDARN
jgi:hypothetical protein